jgi:DNA (cytosine-5)-methyltransferase 1
MTQTLDESGSSCAVSLFSGAGIGELGIRAAGLRFLTMCELEADRAALARVNIPEANVITGDVAEVAGSITECTLQQLEKTRQGLSLQACTAPCHDMSNSGR